MSLAYVILDLVFSEYAMKGIFQYSVKRTLVVLKIERWRQNEPNVQVDVAADTNEIPFLKRRDYRENPFGNDREAGWWRKRAAMGSRGRGSLYRTLRVGQTICPSYFTTVKNQTNNIACRD